MQPIQGQGEIGGQGLSPPEKRALWLLCLALILLLGLRIEWRRDDSSRMPLRPDILVLHPGGLRADAPGVSQLPEELGLESSRLLRFERAFASSDDPLRSALSLLDGDLVLNLDRPLGPASLPLSLAAAGYSTLLATDSAPLSERVQGAFGAGVQVDSLDDLPEELSHLWSQAGGESPRFLYVHLAETSRPLHGSSTEAEKLRHQYRTQIGRLSGLLSRLVARSPSAGRPQLVVLLGASGMELGEHPEEPLRPFEPHLRVPFWMAFRDGRGMPAGSHQDLVAEIDLLPTLMDFLDLRTSDAQSRDQERALGRSLEALVHGWEPSLGPRRLYFAGPGYAGVRNLEWKLMAEVSSPWEIRRSGTSLYSLGEDPGERQDLGRGRALGPVGLELFAALREVLERPRPSEAQAGRQQ